MQTFPRDQVLIEECLHGNEAAWSALIDKYKNLIFSVPIKYGFSSDTAADIFQAVCLALVSELPRLREPRALAGWLIQTTSHKCFRWEQQNRRYAVADLQEGRLSDESSTMPEQVLRQIEREQIVREGVSELTGDCKRLVELLFYRQPRPTYEDVASELRISKGSIGPTRMRCLERLRRLLEKKGF